MACEVPRSAAEELNADDDGSSDYGPDFTSEEQDFLNALLDNITASQGSGVSLSAPRATESTTAPEVSVDVALGLTDIEDQEHVFTKLSESQGRGPLAQDDNGKKGIGYRVG